MMELFLMPRLCTQQGSLWKSFLKACMLWPGSGFSTEQKKTVLHFWFVPVPRLSVIRIPWVSAPSSTSKVHAFHATERSGFHAGIATSLGRARTWSRCACTQHFSYMSLVVDCCCSHSRLEWRRSVTEAEFPEFAAGETLRGS